MIWSACAAISRGLSEWEHPSARFSIRQNVKRIRVLLTAKQTAARLGISQSLVYRLKDDGQIPFYKIGRGAVRFKEEDVERYLASCKGPKDRGRTASQKRTRLRTFKHLDGESLLAAWRRQGVDVSLPDERNAPPSSSSCAPSVPKQS